MFTPRSLSKKTMKVFFVYLPPATIAIKKYGQKPFVTQHFFGFTKNGFVIICNAGK